MGVIATTLVLVFATLVPVASAQPKGIFGDAAGSVSADVRPERTDLRKRRVTVDLSAIAGVALPSGADSIGLNLFPDTNLTAVKKRFERRGAGRFTWVGKVPDDPLSTVILVGGGGQTEGHVFANGKHFSLRGANAASQEVVEIDQSAFPRENCDQIPVGDPAASAAVSPLAGDASADSAAVVDVMVLYTPAARVALGGSDPTAIRNRAQLAVDVTNTTYANSGVALRLRLAHTEEVAYTESGDWNTDLDRLEGTGDGFMDSIHALRDTHRADVVAMLIKDPSFCGLASAIMASATSAFCIIASDCAVSNYTFGHEIGHLQGARHDRYVDSSNGPFAYSYNHGDVDLASRQRTVMAYNNQCNDSGFSCTRIAYWSNPEVLYPSTSTWMGDAVTEDNARVLDNTAGVVANFRTTPTSTWVVQALGDFNGDGTQDVLWRESTAGWLYLWYLNSAGARTGGAYLSPNQLADTNWKIVGVGDFNGDAKADILWRESTAGWLYVWYMNGFAKTGGAYLSPNRLGDTTWQIAGVGDFNGDARPDILWRESTAGWLYVWYMNGVARTGGAYLSPNRLADVNWQIAGVGYFNGDTQPDILWRESTAGWLYTWYMNGATSTGGAYLSPNREETFWKTGGIGDINGDGKSDILWQLNGAMDLNLWMMNGVTRSSVVSVR